MSELFLEKQEQATQTILENDGEKQCAKCGVKASEVFRPFKGTMCRSCISSGFTGGFSQLEDDRINPNPLGNRNYEY